MDIDTNSRTPEDDGQMDTDDSITVSLVSF